MKNTITCRPLVLTGLALALLGLSACPSSSTLLQVMEEDETSRATGKRIVREIVDAEDVPEAFGTSGCIGEHDISGTMETTEKKVTLDIVEENDRDCPPVYLNGPQARKVVGTEDGPTSGPPATDSTSELTGTAPLDPEDSVDEDAETKPDDAESTPEFSGEKTPVSLKT